MNKLMQHLKHELDHGTEDQQLNALRMCIVSLLCHNKGNYVNKLAEAVKIADHEESIVLHALIKSFGDEEYNRIEALWDTYQTPSEVDND